MLITLRGQEGGGEDLSVGEGGGGGEAQICGAGLLRACPRSIVARVDNSCEPRLPVYTLCE